MIFCPAENLVKITNGKGAEDSMRFGIRNLSNHFRLEVEND
jgi:hypothetical protein